MICIAIGFPILTSLIIMILLLLVTLIIFFACLIFLSRQIISITVNWIQIACLGCLWVFLVCLQGYSLEFIDFLGKICPLAGFSCKTRLLVNNLFGFFMVALPYIFTYYLGLEKFLSEVPSIVSNTSSTVGDAVMRDLQTPLALFSDEIAMLFCILMNQTYLFVGEEKLYPILAKVLRRGLKAASNNHNQQRLPRIPRRFASFVRKSYLIGSGLHALLTIIITHLSVDKLIENIIAGNGYLCAVSVFAILLTFGGSWFTIVFITSTMAIKRKTFLISLLGMIIFLPCYALRTQVPNFTSNWQPYSDILWFGPPGYTICMVTLAIFTMIHKHFLLLAFVITVGLIFFPEFYLGCVIQIYGGNPLILTPMTRALVG